MPVMERTAVFADGSNLYFKLRELGFKQLTVFDYRAFTDWLAHGRIVTLRRYYVGVVRAAADDARGQELRREQQRLFAHLTSTAQGFAVQRGYLMRSDGAWHEKGVDVRLAVDLLAGAFRDQFDSAMVISSDTDLVPAIQAVRDLGKTVEYVGFSHKPSLAMLRFATLSRLIIREELLPFERRIG